jgi:hypothetical protein
LRGRRDRLDVGRRAGGRLRLLQPQDHETVIGGQGGAGDGDGAKGREKAKSGQAAHACLQV